MKKYKKYLRYHLEIWLPIISAICLVILFVKSIAYPIKREYDSFKSKDTIVIFPTKHDVSGGKALFIGDSHTAYTNGWQYQVCSKTNMICINTAVGGKRTDWMLQQLLKNIDSSYNYCFIWGGANDAASPYSIDSTISNIQKMVNICNFYGVLPIVLTGFNPELCIDVKGKPLYSNYINKYNQLQASIINKIHYCVIIKNHFIERKDGDCDDFICHMSASGHRKMAEGIIRELNFKTYK
jgi:lysophospholipase L1-like esterase